jgi:thiol-disulfide isomerase/thioredoxin
VVPSREDAAVLPERADSPPAAPRWRYAALALLLAVAAVAAVIVASGSNPDTVAGTVNVKNLPVGPKPPGLSDARGWINSQPLTAGDLKGKVVVYDFWTYSCVNCVRTLPHLRAWYDRYKSDGLVVVGVHSPEFDFEKNHSNVRAAVKRLKVDYPVALDDNMDIWNAFGNQYWPNKYVTDREGRLRFEHIGEGGYRETENVLRELLGVAKDAPRASAVNEGRVGKPAAADQVITAETYLGTLRGVAGAQDGVHTYPKVDGPLPDGSVALEGVWDASGEQITSRALGSSIVLGYRAREVNLVMATATSQPITVVVELDGKPLPANERTPETKVDANGNTFVVVTASDLYRLVLGPAIEQHTLRLIAQGPGLEAFAFTFGA